MRKSFILAAVALSALSAGAWVPEKVVVAMRNGASHSFAIDSLERIGFTEADVVVSEKSGTKQFFPRTSVKSICYGNATAISTPSVRSALTVGADGSIHFPEDAAGLAVTVFSSDGTLRIYTSALSSDAILDGSKLTEGIHIAVLSDGRNFKFIKR